MIGALSRFAGARARLVAGAAGASGLLVAMGDMTKPSECLLGFGGPKPDWDKIRSEIIALCDDDNAPNPSVDGAGGARRAIELGPCIEPTLTR